MPKTQIVEIGTKKVPITEQSYARLKHHLPRVLSAEELERLGNISGDVAAQFDAIGGKAYEILTILVPQLVDAVPEHEFNGFPSAQAQADDVYDEEYAAAAPTIRQIVDAFEVAIEVNGLGKLGNLMGLGQAMVGGGGAGAPPANGRAVTPTSST